MSRIEARFRKLARDGRRALIPFVTAGDPSPDLSLETLHAMVSAGADLVEVGIPFSDPMADGPAVQRASERALAGGMTLSGALDIVRRFRARDDSTPLVMMGYMNPIEAYGCGAFADAAAEAGVDGVITVDLPPEEDADLRDALRRHELDPIYLVSPTTSDDRVRLICERASGFVYYVSLKGVTGAGHLDVNAVQGNVRRVKAATGLPVGVGFGVRDAQSAAAIAEVADAVVVASVLLEQSEKLADWPEAIPGTVAGHVAAMRLAMDGGS